MGRAVAVVHLRSEVSDARHARVLETLTGLLPRVGVEGRGVFACDLRGTERLLGLPERVGARIVAVLERVRIPVAVGIAERPFAARVLAERAPVGEVSRLRPGEERMFLSGLPVGVLPLEEELREELGLLGIRTVGEFADLERGAVLDRFGRAAAAAHALARGEDAGEVRGAAPRRRIVAKRSWDAPIDRTDQLLFALRAALDDLGTELRMDGLAAMRLEARLENGNLAAAQAVEPAALLRSLRWALEERPGREGLGLVTGVRIEATEVELVRGRQIGLFAADAAREEEAIAVARYLRSRLGPGAVLRPRVTDPESRVAEREVEWEEAVS